MMMMMMFHNLAGAAIPCHARSISPGLDHVDHANDVDKLRMAWIIQGLSMRMNGAGAAGRRGAPGGGGTCPFQDEIWSSTDSINPCL